MIPKPGPLHSSLWDGVRGGQLPATLGSDTVGGLCGKAVAGGGLSAARGFGHPRRNPIKGSGGTGEGGNANQFFEAPPSCGFQGVELGLNILDPPPGAEGRAGRGSAFGNDSRFPVWFLSRGPWNTLTPVICVHSTTLPFTQLFFFSSLLLFLFSGLFTFLLSLLLNCVRQSNRVSPCLFGKNVQTRRAGR